MADTAERTLAAIMFTDMVGYSSLTQKDESLALELLEAHHALLRPFFPKYGGKEIKTIGDAFLVKFASALEAARCAIEMQRTLVMYNATATPQKRIQIRIGIHVGDVIHQNEDVFGDAVNIASRIEPLARAGGVCVSEDVARQIGISHEASGENKARHFYCGAQARSPRICLPYLQDDVCLGS